MIGTTMQRACGFRHLGGIYITLPTAPGGRPLADFLIDPPRPISPFEYAMWGLAPRGVKGVEMTDSSGRTSYHVVDIVGRDSYPNVADVIEEAKVMGFSRRVAERSIDWKRVTSQSMYILAHPRAQINNWQEYNNATSHHCPKRLMQHDYITVTESCLGFTYEDVEFGVARGEREVIRHLPSVSYHARRRPEGIKSDYTLAFFAAYPIQVEVVRDPEDLSISEQIADRIRGHGISVMEVDS